MLNQSQSSAMAKDHCSGRKLNMFMMMKMTSVINTSVPISTLLLSTDILLKTNHDL